MDIQPKDLKIDLFYPTSGCGYSYPVVKILHIPTGIVTECDDERSPHRAKQVAMNKLREQLKLGPVQLELF